MLNIGSKQNHCSKIILLSSRQTKNQQDKLQIQSKRLITKQLQIKTNKTTQMRKIFSFTVPSTSFSLLSTSGLSHSFSDSIHSSTVAGAQNFSDSLHNFLPRSVVTALRLCSCSRFCRFEFSSYERIRYNLFGNWSLHFIC